MYECEGCGVVLEECWWWRCDVHGVSECDGCSMPGGGPRPYDEGSHRFRCAATFGVTPDGVQWCGGVVDEGG
jgi:hypothetical protein